MRNIKFAVAILIAILIGVVIFANGHDVTVYAWPDVTDYGLPASPSYSLALGVFGLICGVVGFMLGTMREFLREGTVRREGRKSRKEAQALKAKIDELTADQRDDDIPQLAAR